METGSFSSPDHKLEMVIQFTKKNGRQIILGLINGTSFEYTYSMRNKNDYTRDVTGIQMDKMTNPRERSPVEKRDAQTTNNYN